MEIILTIYFRTRSGSGRIQSFPTMNDCLRELTKYNPELIDSVNITITHS